MRLSAKAPHLFHKHIHATLDTNTAVKIIFCCCFASAAVGIVDILHFFVVAAAAVVNAEYDTKEFIDFWKSASKSNCFHIHKMNEKKTNKHWQTIEVSLFSKNSHTLKEHNREHTCVYEYVCVQYIYRLHLFCLLSINVRMYLHKSVQK